MAEIIWRNKMTDNTRGMQLVMAGWLATGLSEINYEPQEEYSACRSCLTEKEQSARKKKNIAQRKARRKNRK